VLVHREPFCKFFMSVFVEERLEVFGNVAWKLGEKCMKLISMWGQLASNSAVYGKVYNHVSKIILEFGTSVSSRLCVAFHFSAIQT